MPLIIAHRGYSTRFRENSPAAWIGAIDAKADMIEVDLRQTRDGAIVCGHDANLMRLARREEAIAEIESAELAEISAGGLPVAPTLGTLFDTVPADVPLLFDVKDERPESIDRLIPALLASGRETLTLGFHTLEAVTQSRDMGWSFPILGFLRNPAHEEDFFTLGGDILRIWEWDASSERLAQHIDRGRPVWVTAGEGATGRRVGEFDAGELVRFHRAGVGGILVNDPAAARTAMKAGEAL